jgi:hypothetical protein
LHPIGNQLQYQWIAYNEAGIQLLSFRVPPSRIAISGTQNQAAMVTVSSPGVAHVILAVTDNGLPNLTSYRRVILNAQ